MTAAIEEGMNLAAIADKKAWLLFYFEAHTAAAFDQICTSADQACFFSHVRSSATLSAQ